MLVHTYSLSSTTLLSLVTSYQHLGKGLVSHGEKSGVEFVGLFMLYVGYVRRRKKEGDASLETT